MRFAQFLPETFSADAGTNEEDFKAFDFEAFPTMQKSAKGL